jgi:fused signal recognition particle receptor
VKLKDSEEHSKWDKMFDLLKKKINSFTEKVKKRVERKEETVSIEKESVVEAKEKEVLKPVDVKTEEAVEKKKIKPIEPERKPKAKVSIKSRVKGIVKGKIEIKERDIKEFLDELELALLESDVEQETAKEMVSEIKEKIVGKEIERGKDIETVLKKEIKETLLKAMKTKKLDFFELLEKKPFVILFLGPNGAGKTTSMAKLSFLLQSKGKTVIWAASDTFRAASIEQLEKHAKNLGIRVVKHSYGADPAAVAFDAVKAAEAGKIDVVMVDSAGRQETNKNLLNELKKIDRVIKPDLKLFVGEAMAGNALLEQAKQFNEWIGIDGFILTKIDTDTKGGTIISLLHQLKKPVLFIGTGQNYEDLVEFKPEFIIERVVG